MSYADIHNYITKRPMSSLFVIFWWSELGTEESRSAL
jgi:hypothetical protein